MTDTQLIRPTAAKPRGRFYFQIGAVIVVVAFVALFAASLQLTAAGQLHAGSAPDFTFTQFDGKQFQLSDLRGKVVVLNIWASWCIPCRAEAPILEHAWRAYKDKGLILLGADYIDTEPAALAFLKEFDITYPNGPDFGSNIYRLFHARGVPETYFIDQQGNIAHTVIGPTNEAALKATLDELLAKGAIAQ